MPARRLLLSRQPSPWMATTVAWCEARARARRPSGRSRRRRRRHCRSDQWRSNGNSHEPKVGFEVRTAEPRSHRPATTWKIEPGPWPRWGRASPVRARRLAVEGQGADLVHDQQAVAVRGALHGLLELGPGAARSRASARGLWRWWSAPSGRAGSPGSPRRSRCARCPRPRGRAAPRSRATLHEPKVRARAAKARLASWIRFPGAPVAKAEACPGPRSGVEALERLDGGDAGHAGGHLAHAHPPRVDPGRAAPPRGRRRARGPWRRRPGPRRATPHRSS